MDQLAKSIMNNEIYPFEEFSFKEVISNVIINYLKGISTRDGVELIEKLEKKLF
jgi:hypothetical protein